MSRPPRSPAARAAATRGFTLVSAIFLLVVLAVLGAAIVIVSTTQQIGSAMDVQGSRIYQAARAGIEWGVYQQTRSVSCAGSASFAFTAPTLTGITVTVTCTAYTDGSGGPAVHVIQSTACNQPSGGNCPNTSPGSNYIERRLKVTI